MPAPAADRRLVTAFGVIPVRQVFLIAALVMVSVAAPRAATTVQDTLEIRLAVRALDELHGEWFDQLRELIATARALAVADDTYEFVSRPNIPYVSAHYAPEQLAADRIDTVLIINSHRKPIFWRRVNQGRNRGFPDAMAFLAELPVLPAPAAAGVPGVAGAALLTHGPTLVVAMPIYATNGMGRARGWLIAARVLDALQWDRYGELAQIPIQSVNPTATSLAGYITTVRQAATVGMPASLFPERERLALWITLLVVITGVAAVSSRVLKGWGEKAAGMRVRVHPTDATAVSARLGGGARPEIEPPHSNSSKRAPEPVGTGSRVGQVRDLLQARIAASGAVFRYQPQIDLRTGQVAGVEALLCVPGLPEYRPAIELVTEIETAGLGMALLERRLQEACREQRAWLRKIGHDFAIGVPVSQRMLANADLLPLVQRILAEHQLAPSMLELEVEEMVLGKRASALHTLAKVHEAGILIAIDGFDATHSNLRLLTILPISKLRVDLWLLLRMGDRVREALLFDAILGAARGLGISVCATGVASPDLLAAVLQHGRPLAQGTAVGSPLEGSDFLELLRGSSVDTATLRPLDLGAQLRAESA
jgi:EAL domain-containing protein (putative c-di-GMP-specific phosphodiesterase class I)/sensor domain CHASE-containing protein